MDVNFDVDGAIYRLPEQQATTLGEQLRLTAAGQRDDSGIEGARAVADLIKDVLAGAFDDPIPLEGEAAEAVFYVLNVAVDPTNPAIADAYALYEAVRTLCEQRLEHDR